MSVAGEVVRKTEPAAGTPSQDYIQLIFVNFFSPALIALLCVVASGKFLSSVFRAGFPDKDRISLNLFFVRFSATGDEFYFGMVPFLAFLVLTIVFGGKNVASYMLNQTGLNVAIYSGECVVAAVFSLFFSVVLFVIVKNIRPVPIVSAADRQAQIQHVKDQAKGSMQ